MDWKIGSSSKQFPAVSEGQHPAVLVAITNLGIVEDKFGARETIRLCWITPECDEKDEPLLVFQTMGMSCHEKSNLAKLVRSLGRPAPDEDFDVRSLLGANALVDIEQNVKDGRTYANIITLTKLPKGQENVEVPANWTVPRFKRGTTVSVLDEWESEPAEAKKEKPYVATDDDVPVF